MLSFFVLQIKDFDEFGFKQRFDRFFFVSSKAGKPLFYFP